MFKRRTLFVVGAGASAEAGLPVGAGLANVIRQRTDLQTSEFNTKPSDGPLYSQFTRVAPGAVKGYVRGFKTIHDGILLANSIDDFLHIHGADQSVVEVGKAAIVRAILDAERRSKLFFSRSNIYNKPSYGNFADTWFVKFMRVLGPGTSVANIRDALKQVSFIVFNYDRCVEHFLYYALQDLYSMTAQEAADIVASITIIHPYGSLGAIDDIPFGGVDDHNYEFRALGARIRTYTEQFSKPHLVNSIKQQVRDAEGIVFLGFAYHVQNMDLLNPGEPGDEKVIYGTAYGMSDADTSHVKSTLADFFPEEYASHVIPSSNNHIRLENKLTSAQLFDYYAKSIAG